jgi:hypothetical protein
MADASEGDALRGPTFAFIFTLDESPVPMCQLDAAADRSMPKALGDFKIKGALYKKSVSTFHLL